MALPWPESHQRLLEQREEFGNMGMMRMLVEGLKIQQLVTAGTSTLKVVEAARRMRQVV